MPELVEARPHSAQGPGLAHTPEDTSATGLAETATRQPRALDLPFGESAYQVAAQIEEIFPRVHSPVVFTAATAGFLSHAERVFLRQIREDIGDHQTPGAELCLDFVEGVGLALANSPSVRVAAFVDDEDDELVSLIAHSRALKRQVEFEFSNDSNTINIIKIDEHMHRDEHTCEQGSRRLSEALVWLDLGT